ncbi:MAG: hypothetical protein V1902_00935 [Candidatus Falkowbacteria bacterium]
MRRAVSTSPPAQNCPSWSQEGVCWDLGPGIVGHADVQDNTHGDPGAAFDWNHFLSLVQSYYSSVPSTAPNAEAEFYKAFGGKVGDDIISQAEKEATGCCLLDNGLSLPALTEMDCQGVASAEAGGYTFTKGDCK